jgi:hypothetical protein
MAEYALLLAHAVGALGHAGLMWVKDAMPHSLHDALTLATTWPGWVAGGVVAGWILFVRHPR